MRELPQCLSHTESFNYADDSALLKVFGHNSAVWSVDHFSKQTLERHQAITEVNADLSSLIDFGKKWKVKFEPTKTHAMLVSNTNDYCFPCMSQLVFGAAHVKFQEELALVGFVFNKKLTWNLEANAKQGVFKRPSSSWCNVPSQEFAWLLRFGNTLYSLCSINFGIRKLGILCCCPGILADVGQNPGNC